MCRPASHDCSPPGGGAAAIPVAGAGSAPGAGPAAGTACGSILTAELVTLRLFAGCAEMSPAWQVTAANITTNDAAAHVFDSFPAPPSIQRHQPSNRIASSFDPADLHPVVPRQTASYSPERVLAWLSPQSARHSAIVPLFSRFLMGFPGLTSSFLSFSRVRYSTADSRMQ